VTRFEAVATFGFVDDSKRSTVRIRSPDVAVYSPAALDLTIDVVIQSPASATQRETQDGQCTLLKVSIECLQQHTLSTHPEITCRYFVPQLTSFLGVQPLAFLALQDLLILILRLFQTQQIGQQREALGRLGGYGSLD